MRNSAAVVAQLSPAVVSFAPQNPEFLNQQLQSRLLSAAFHHLNIHHQAARSVISRPWPHKQQHHQQQQS
jgi:hypothetical protein